MAVVGGRDQTIQGDLADVLQQFHGVDAARILALCPHVAGIVLALGTLRARRGKGPVIGVLNPAIRRIHQADDLIEGVCPLPFGCRVAAVDRAGEIEVRIALRNEVSVKVRDGAVGVGVHRIVRRVGSNLLRSCETRRNWSSWSAGTTARGPRTGSSSSLTAIHFPPSARTIGP